MRIRCSRPTVVYSTYGGTVRCKGLVTLSLTRACMAVIRCLKEERDWLVLNLVLSEVPSVLQNKGMLTRYHRYLIRRRGTGSSLTSSSQRSPASSRTRACSRGTTDTIFNKEERDWLVLNLVLSEVPSVLQNKGMLTR
jgi:hypothetical protein